MADILKKVAKWPSEIRSIGERLHRIISQSAPELTPKFLWGAPGYARDGKVVIHFREDDGVVTFGLTEHARLKVPSSSSDKLIPTSWTLTDIDEATESRIAEIVRQAVG